MEKQLSFAREIKQKLKGTWDSPCVEICHYQGGHSFCRACGLTRTEKKSWPQASAEAKAVITALAADRTRTTVHR